MTAPENRKEEIIRISAKLFKEKGFRAVSMRDLAQVMGIKAASLYNHIDSKEEILNHIIIGIAEEFTKGIAEIMDANDSHLSKLRAVIFQHVDITSNHSDGMASLNNDWMHLKDQREYYLHLRKSYEENFRRILAEGVTAGELRKIDIEVALFSILSTLRSLYLWIPKKEVIDKNALATDLSEVLLNGINK